MHSQLCTTPRDLPDPITIPQMQNEGDGKRVESLIYISHSTTVETLVKESFVQVGVSNK